MGSHLQLDPPAFGCSLLQLSLVLHAGLIQQPAKASCLLRAGRGRAASFLTDMFETIHAECIGGKRKGQTGDATGGEGKTQEDG